MLPHEISASPGAARIGRTPPRQASALDRRRMRARSIRFVEQATAQKLAVRRNRTRY